MVERCVPDHTSFVIWTQKISHKSNWSAQYNSHSCNLRLPRLSRSLPLKTARSRMGAVDSETMRSFLSTSCLSWPFRGNNLWGNRMVQTPWNAITDFASLYTITGLQSSEKQRDCDWWLLPASHLFPSTTLMSDKKARAVLQWNGNFKENRMRWIL